MTQKQPIDLLIAAHRKRVIVENIDIPVEEGVIIEAVLEAPDIYAIQELQDRIYRKMYEVYRQDGLDQAPIDEKEWERELLLYDVETRELIVKTKPDNSAQQGAGKFAKIRTIQELIPQYLKDRKTNKPLCPDDDSRKKFKEILCSDTNLSNLLAQAYVRLAKKIGEAGKQAKNLSAPTPSGKSEKE
uniref:Uncharacterized protein n=1 Tax=viral metagenome TaxID=1070528 RepID=A0A6M3JYX0_9ZZZZ